MEPRPLPGTVPGVPTWLWIAALVLVLVAGCRGRSGEVAPEATPTPTSSPTQAIQAEGSPVPSPTEGTPVSTPTPAPGTSQPSPEAQTPQAETPVAVSSPTPVPPTSTPTPSPTRPWVVGTPTPTPTATPSVEPATPVPTVAGTATPTSTPTATPTPGMGTPTPVPTPTGPPPALGDVVVRSHRSYRVGNTLVVVGEVLNRGEVDAYGVTVSAAFYDGSGRLVGTETQTTLLPWTGPGQTTPFRLELADAPASVARYDLSLRWDDVSVLDFVRLTLVSQEVRREEGLVVEGQVRNDHPFPVAGIQVAATFYDARGEVVETARGLVAAESVAPGGAVDYTVQVGQPELPFDRVEVQVQGYRAFRE